MTLAIRLFAALAAAIIALALIDPPVMDTLPGMVPPGGILYESLSRQRLPVPEAPELLLVQTGSPDERAALGPLELADFVLTLKEMDTDKVLFLLPTERSSDTTELSPERRRNLEARFEKEFSLIDKNIATLFEAIRLGSIRTKDSSRFVQELQALVNLSKSRLLSETIEGDNSGRLLLSQAQATFGAGHYAGDLADLGLALPDYPGAYAVIERPVPAEGTLPFQRIDLREVVRYSTLDKALYGILADMEHAGYLASLDPGSHPPALYEHALSLRQNLLAKPGDAAARSWREAREQYLRSVRTLLSGKAETELLAGFDSLLAAETLGDSGTTRINDLRQAVAATFAAARSAFNEFQPSRDRLRGALRGALCILGPVSDPRLLAEGTAPDSTQAEVAAFLANGILTDSHFRVTTGPWYRIWIFLPAVAAAVLLAPFGTLVSAILGLGSIAASAGLFSLLFVFKGVWIDPLVVAGLVAVAVAASLAVELAARVRITMLLRRRTGNRLPEPALTALAARHILPPATDLTARAAILAVRHYGEASHADLDDSARHAASLRAFHDAAAAEITKRGGVVLGVDEFILTAGFGTPLHASSNGLGMDSAEAAKQACTAVLDIAASAPELSGEWRFGLDLGDCDFFYSSVDGYSAVGRAVNYARLLSGLSSKYNSRILVTQGIAAEAGTGFRTRRLDSLVEKASGNEHAFYELISPLKP
jgi:hypothetical protein